ncbi:hypothetical protein AB0M91_19695 [Micromonospora rifamycinica]|uniref:hypothetical protein n=1 Tax=Micromonospora rifamycinica TaxID=291594 RepID=UPI00342F99B8
MTAPDGYADRLAEVAAELVVRVRDDDPEANARWLAATLTAAEQRDLLYVLAAAVPDDRPWVELTAWVPRRQLRPHGTPAAAERHRYRRERLCDECRDAERARDRIRKRDQRARARQAVPKAA